MEVLGASGDAEVPVPAWNYEEAEPRTDACMPLREALGLCYDLRQGISPLLTPPAQDMAHIVHPSTHRI